MRVIVLENQPSSQLGGQEKNLVEISQGLAFRGHQVSLVYTKPGDLLKTYERFCKQIIQINRYHPERKRILETLVFLRDVLDDIKRIPITSNSVIFCNDFSSVLFGSLISYASNIPLVHYIQLPGSEFKIKWRFGLKRVSQSIAVSNQTKQRWVKFGVPEDKISVVHNGTDTERFKPLRNIEQIRKEYQIPKDKKIILYVGRLNPDKGIEILIKAFSLAVKCGIDACLLIAGKPAFNHNDNLSYLQQYQNFLTQMVIDLEIDKSTHFLGHISNTPALYSVSDVTVVPSIWAEPFGRVVTESLACGTPVIASNIGGIPEILQPDFKDFLFEPGNIKELSHLLLKVVKLKSEQPKLTHRCREHITKQFGFEKTIDRIEKVLINIAQQ